MSEGWMLIISSAVGAIAALVGSIATAIINKVSEAKQRRKELIMTTALEYWKRTDQKAVEIFLSEKYPGPINSYPLESFIVSIAKASEVLGNDRISEADVLKVIRELRSLNLATYQEARDHTADMSAETTGHNKA